MLEDLIAEMEDGEAFLNKVEYIKKKNIILVGEQFYIQLFLNYNLLNLHYVKIVNSKNNIYWSNSIRIEYLKKITRKNEDIVVFCGGNKIRHIELMDYNFFDMESIKNSGTFYFENDLYIVDDVKYVASNPKYMARAYDKIDESLLEDYLNELCKAPSNRRLNKAGQICLFDYTGKYIHYKHGRRVTIDEPKDFEFCIHIFGDSRVSGYMLEDKDVFTNILQKMLNSCGMKIKVINYGIPGRDIDRIFYQVKMANIRKRDLVFVMTACHEYRENAIDKQMEYISYLKDIKKICNYKKAYFTYINLPTTIEIYTPNNDELLISHIYKNYKFNEYSREGIENYKGLIFRRLMEAGIYCLDALEVFEKDRNDLLFINMHHYSPAGNVILADFIFNILKSYLQNRDIPGKTIKKSDNNIRKWIKTERQKNSFKSKIVFKKELIESNPYIKYIQKDAIKKEIKKILYSFNRTGAIVMNANPFTLGHKFLVETAIKEVDFLYIFVLTEDKSFFKTQERIIMVYEGIKEMKNVIVLPGGKDIISDITFPEYFMKRELQNTKVDAYKDIEKFGLYVAPKYGIKIRFVGEEPFDNITKQYNEQMKKELIHFGIEVREIPRCVDINGLEISATRVRKACEEKRWDDLAALVPESTIKYIRNNIMRW